MANKSYLDYAGLKRVLKRFLPGIRKIWHGTVDEWEALSLAEKEKYDQAEITEPNYTKDIFTDTVKGGDNRMLTSSGMWHFLNRICGYVKPGDWVVQTHTGWKNNQTYTLRDVPPGVYLLQTKVRGEPNGTPFYIVANCQGSNNVLSAASDIFDVASISRDIIKVEQTQDVTLTYSFYNNGGSNRTAFSANLLRIR